MDDGCRLRDDPDLRPPRRDDRRLHVEPAKALAVLRRSRAPGGRRPASDGAWTWLGPGRRDRAAGGRRRADGDVATAMEPASMRVTAAYGRTGFDIEIPSD